MISRNAIRPFFGAVLLLLAFTLVAQAQKIHVAVPDKSVDFSKFKDLVKTNQVKVNRLFARMLEILS